MFFRKLLSSEKHSSVAHRPLSRSKGDLSALELQDEVILCSQGLDLKNDPLKAEADNNEDLLYVQYIHCILLFYYNLYCLLVVRTR